MKKNRFLIGFLLLITSGSFAQESFTLKGAIEYGLQNNLKMSKAFNEKDRARQREKEAFSTYLPQVNGTVTLDDNLKRQAMVFPANPLMPEGATVRMGTQYSTGAVVQLDQTIYDQAAMLGIKAARPNKAMADLKYQQSEEGIIYDVSYSYYQVFVFKQYLNLQLENKKKQEQLLAIAKLQLDKGVIKKNDYNKILVTLNNTLSQLSLAEQNLELANSRLKNVMGLPLDKEIVLADTAILKSNVRLAKESEFDVQNRTDFKLQQTQIIFHDLDSRRIRGGGLPKLTAYARYGVQAMGNDFQESFNRKFDYSSIGLKLSVPLFDGLRRNAQYKQARIDMKNAQADLLLNERSYQVEYSNAKVQLNKSASSLENNQSNLKLAEEVFQTTSLEYQRGVTDLTNLLNAEYSYKDAQINYINSLLNYYTAQLDIEKSSGNLKNFASSL
ncbi:TolC family protein [Sporocytophaga myxococcoides]|uniref:TolC family protein n=1 Tax=Sporocytophaga myxococcoides TaxID=153721 RepID=UPI00048A77EF|nr:TolC family protein [Sporocytophaga myxococcoides]